jgi:predicted unusual protein kinase regulating ubiquinone biosynthesis (AarF/ABC1/UbiB family)
MQRLRANLLRRGMYVPHVYSDLCTGRVLVMEFVSGVLMSDYIATLRTDPQRVEAWQRANNVDPKRISRRFSLSILRQIIEDNLYHGDLHPGNIVLLRDSRVVLLDFGAVGSTDREYLLLFSALMEATAKREYSRATDIALLMTGRLPRTDVSGARAEVTRELQAWGRRADVATLPYTVKSADALNLAIMRTFFKHGITFEWAFLRIRRALAPMDATAMHLAPEANYTETMRAYFRRARRRALRTRVRSAVAKTAGSVVAPRADLDRQVQNIVDLALQIERRHVRPAVRTLTAASTFLRTGARLGRAVAAGAGVFGLGMLAAQHGPSCVREATAWAMSDVVTRAPSWDWQTWVALTLASVATARSARAVAAS